MKRLILAGAFAALCTVTGLAARPSASTPAVAPDPIAIHAGCAKMCVDCMVACEAMTHHCGGLAQAGGKEHVKPMQLAADCAEFCTLSAKLTARRSDLSPAACEACAAACDRCAAECALFPDVPTMKACGESCKACAASCREMVKMVAQK